MRRCIEPRLLSPLLLALAAAPAGAQIGPTGQAAADSAAVVAVIDAFHAALVAGDGARARALLTDDARIVEGGSVETVEEYVSHHLAADMAFAQAVDRDRALSAVEVRGDIAWTLSTSHATGSYRGRDIDSSGAELVVLSRDDRWRIQAIHWSSR